MSTTDASLLIIVLLWLTVKEILWHPLPQQIQFPTFTKTGGFPGEQHASLSGVKDLEMLRFDLFKNHILSLANSFVSKWESLNVSAIHSAHLDDYFCVSALVRTRSWR